MTALEQNVASFMPVQLISVTSTDIRSDPTFWSLMRQLLVSAQLDTWFDAGCALLQLMHCLH